MKLVNGTNTAGSQTAGSHAEFVLNGTTMYATSTTVDSTVTGLTGVTLNLKQAKAGTTIQINIQKDTDALKAAIKDVVEKYNAAISYIDQQTDAKNDMPLASETRLKSLRSQIRNLFTSQVGALSGTSYDSLQQVGISTGPVGSSAGNATPKLQLDESKLTAALAADPTTVEKLFIGQNLTGALNNTAFDDNMEGTFTKVFQLLADQTYTDGNGNTGYGALYGGTGENNKGLFAAYQSAAQKRIDTINKSIQKAEDRLLIKEKTLRQQFLAMDRMIGQYQNQGNALAGLIAQLTANNKA
jgi:flagellar hook-associated protein 2